MAWVRIDDAWPTHPKAIAAGPMARDLYLAALCWCNRHVAVVSPSCRRRVSEGHVPRAAIPSISNGLRAVYRLADRLCAVGLWEPCGDDYHIHDYAEYQPTRDEVLARRRAAAIRQERSRSRRDSRVSHTVGNGVSHTVSNAVSHSAPARPDPKVLPSVGSPVQSPSPASAPDGRPGSGNTKRKKALAAEQAEYEQVRRQEWAMLTPQQWEARIKLGMVPPPTVT